MNKDNIITSIITNAVTAILLIEHLCGLELALELMVISAIFTLAVHIKILAKYAVTIIREN